VNFVNFETGDFSACASHTGPASVVTSPVYDGTYAAGWARTNQTANFEIRQSGTTYYNLATAYFQFYFLYQALSPGGDSSIVNFQDGSSVYKCAIHINNQGKLVLYDFNGVIMGTGGSVLQGGIWYSIQAQVNTGASVSFIVRINGVQELNASGNLGSNNNGSVKFGGNVNYTDTFYFDDIGIDNAAYPALITGNVFNLQWLGNNDFPFNNFVQNRRAYLPPSPDRSQLILTSLDQFVPAQFGFLPNQEAPRQPPRRPLAGIPGFATSDVLSTVPATVGLQQVSDLLHATRPVNAGQFSRHNDPYLSIPPQGWLRHEEAPRRIKPWLHVVSPDRSQYLSDPAPLTLTVFFQDLTRDVSRPRALAILREPGERAPDPGLQLPAGLPWAGQQQPANPNRRLTLETIVGITPLPAPVGQLNFVPQPVDVLPFARRPLAGPAGSDQTPLAVSPGIIIAISPPGSWAMPTDQGRQLRVRLDPQQATFGLPVDLQPIDTQSWNRPAEQIVRPRLQVRAGESRDVFQFLAIATADLQSGWQQQTADKPRPFSQRQIDVTSFIPTTITTGDDSAALQVWNLPPQVPRFQLWQASRFQEAASFVGNLPGAISLVASGPWIVIDLFVYFAGAFQVSAREE
jgi:hypothetical protein